MNNLFETLKSQFPDINIEQILANLGVTSSEELIQNLSNHEFAQQLTTQLTENGVNIQEFTNLISSQGIEIPENFSIDLADHTDLINQAKDILGGFFG